MSSKTKSVTFIGNTHLDCFVQYEALVKSLTVSKEIDTHSREITEVIWVDSIWELIENTMSEKNPHLHSMLTVLYKVNTYIKDNRY